jgi:hypothetical protein
VPAKVGCTAAQAEQDPLAGYHTVNGDGHSHCDFSMCIFLEFRNRPRWALRLSQNRDFRKIAEGALGGVRKAV